MWDHGDKWLKHFKKNSYEWIIYRNVGQICGSIHSVLGRALQKQAHVLKHFSINGRK